MAFTSPATDHSGLTSGLGGKTKTFKDFVVRRTCLDEENKNAMVCSDKGSGLRSRGLFRLFVLPLIYSVLVMLIIIKHSISLLVLLLITPFVVASTSHHIPHKRIVLN